MIPLFRLRSSPRSTRRSTKTATPTSFSLATPLPSPAGKLLRSRMPGPSDFLTRRPPCLSFPLATDGTNTFILAEGGVPYTDVAADAIPWQFGTKGSSETLITRAFDAVEEGARDR